MSRADQPVRRRQILVGTLAAAVVLAGVVGLAEGLRRPPPGAGEQGSPVEDVGDPRVPTRCPDPVGEDIPRDGRESAPVDPPVDVRSGQLLDCPESYDGRRVRYRGEAIGGVLPRAGGAWVQVNDDVYADPTGPLPGHRVYRGGNAGVGVFVPSELVDAVGTVGGPRTHGDLVDVVGVFHRVDAETREVTVIRASSLDVVRTGTTVADPPLPDRQVAAGVLAVLALATVVTERVVARRRLFG